MGYSAILATRGKEVVTEMKMLGIKQMKQADKVLYHKKRCKERDMSWWRNCTFNQIWSEDYESGAYLICAARTIDHLFSSEETWHTFPKVRKFEAGNANWTFNLTLFFPDATITDAVDSLPRQS